MGNHFCYARRHHEAQNFSALYLGQIPRLLVQKTYLLMSQVTRAEVAEHPAASWLTVEPE